MGSEGTPGRVPMSARWAVAPARTLRWTVATALTLTLAACGGGDSGSHGQDVTDDVDADALPDDTLAPSDDLADTWRQGQLGQACAENNDCASGWCVPSSNGLVCTSGCDAGCPNGWECGQIVNQTTDIVFVCVDPTITLCQPCDTDEDCAAYAPGAGHRCLDSGPSGRFCGQACVVGAAQCPPSYTCEPDDSSVGDGGEGQCIPAQGLATCACNPLGTALEFATECHVTNALGTCEGVRWCDASGLTPCDARVPTAEHCDGIDDDCNGQIDDGLPAGAPCDIVNAHGTCPGLGFCVAGELQCVGTAA